MARKISNEQRYRKADEITSTLDSHYHEADDNARNGGTCRDFKLFERMFSGAIKDARIGPDSFTKSCERRSFRLSDRLHKKLKDSVENGATERQLDQYGRRITKVINE